MKILIANDDGINSLGIKALADKFSAVGHKVTVIAPDSQRSACGHGIMSLKGIRYNEVSLSDSYKAYSCNGTPADCVKLGILHVLKDDLPDIVISGINYGTNIGSDVIYSGTISAASEAAYQGIRAIAVSTNRIGYDEHIDEVCDYILKILPKLLDADLPTQTVININYPITAPCRGTAVVKAGINLYSDVYVANADDSFSVVLMGKPVKSELNDQDTDIEFFNRGYATISVLDLDRNDYNSINKLRKFLNE